MDGFLALQIPLLGCFTINVVKAGKKKDRFKIIQRYILSQKDSKKELQFLTSLLKGYVERSTRCDRLVVNYLQLDSIIDYFENYPLHSSKKNLLILGKQFTYIEKNQRTLQKLFYTKFLIYKKRN
jgi:hypothetical protein